MRFTPEWLRDHPNDQGLVDVMNAGSSHDKGDEVKRGEAAQLFARSSHDTWDRLHCISAPTLVAAGRYDGLAPLDNSETLAGVIPGAELDVFEGGHLFIVQDPRALPRIIDHLLGH